MTADEWWTEAERYNDAHAVEALTAWRTSLDYREAFEAWRAECAERARVVLARDRDVLMGQEAYEAAMAEAQRTYAQEVAQDAPPFRRLLLYRMVMVPLMARLHRMRGRQHEARPRSRDHTREIEAARAVAWATLIAVQRDRALCPFHDDHHPSLWIKNGFAWCFVCQRGWDQIAFVMERDSRRFLDAVRWLAGDTS
mgnify:FL=1